jgi:hypothetical protein
MMSSSPCAALDGTSLPCFVTNGLDDLMPGSLLSLDGCLDAFDANTGSSPDCGWEYAPAGLAEPFCFCLPGAVTSFAGLCRGDFFTLVSELDNLKIGPD